MRGRPKLEGARSDVSGRLLLGNCRVCGSKIHQESTFCRNHQPRLGRPKILPDKACVYCGKAFRPATPTLQTCRALECRTRRYVDYWASRKNPNKTDVTRAKRLRSGHRRRATGWRPEAGRWRRICVRDGWVCWICERAIDPTLEPLGRTGGNKFGGTADHVVPVSLGGSDTDDNLRAAHFCCNSRRAAGRLKVSA